MHWNWLLSQKKLQQLGVDAVLNRYLIIALQQFPDPVDSFEKTKYVSYCALWKLLGKVRVQRRI